MLNRLNISLALALSATAATAATPDQVGTYEGTLTGKKYTPNEPKGTPYKGAVTFILGADDYYTFGLPDVGSISAGVNRFFGASTGVTWFNAYGYHLNTSLHFKPGSIKGSALYSYENGTTFTFAIEGKLSLKKQTAP